MTTQEFLTTFTEFGNIAITPVLAIFLILYVRARAGSASFLYGRIWRFLGGKKDYHSKNLQELHEKLTDFEKFRYDTGIRFRNSRKIIETTNWLRENRIGLEEITRTRFFFDSERVTMREPWLKTYKFWYVAANSFLCGVFLIWLLALLPGALLTIKKTGTKVWVTNTEAKAWGWEQWETLQSCARTNESEERKAKEKESTEKNRANPKEKIPEAEGYPLGFTDEKTLEDYNKSVVCQLLASDQKTEYLERAMFFQRFYGTLFLLVSFIFAFAAKQELSIAKQANDLCKLLKNKL
ncbi:DUF6216 family protein [Pseudomonas citronellolis]|uniref:DUF6216 family protein n=1 Tax=Pseudomonas citronellolis TaxID=53408 RepID=UPI002D787ACC|nr:DUF6216 family protein [Pseudomonas citronellolis]WRT82614.1 DUF6216 family protein [Pseudomonas citronellolis]